MRNDPQRAKRILFEIWQQLDNSDVNTFHESSISDHKPKEAEVITSGEYIKDPLHNSFVDEFDKWVSQYF